VATFVADCAAENFLKSVQLAHTIPSVSKVVAGIATLGDELFVLRCNNLEDIFLDYDYDCALIQVFKPSVNMDCQRNIDVGVGAQWFRGLAACEFNQCLYASAMHTRAIYKVSPVTNNVVNQWSVNDQPYGLSVDSVHNLLVACYYTHKVQVFTTDGALVREIDLQPSGITNPTHVVQLPDWNFGITHYGSEHGYSVVGYFGKFVKSAKGPAGNADGQMNCPYGFSVSKGKVFIADQLNNRLLLLNSESMSFEQLPPSFNVGFKHPSCIHFDESAGVMYVGEWDGGRVFCFKK